MGWPEMKRKIPAGSSYHEIIRSPPTKQLRSVCYVLLVCCLILLLLKLSIGRINNVSDDLNGYLPNFSSHHQQLDEMNLSELSLLFGSDKGPTGHNFTRIYERYFAPLREQPIRLLEIGIYRGSSIKLWESYFPAAELHFIDITDAYLQYNLSSRSQLHLMDQGNKTALREFANRIGQFDVIIDDGGHRMNQQIDTFKELFHLIKPEGFFVIEDLHTSYWSQFGGRGSPGEPRAGALTAISYLKDLLDGVNFVGAYTSRAASGNLTDEVRAKMDYFTLHIDSMHFYDSICFIFAK